MDMFDRLIDRRCFWLFHKWCKMNGNGSTYSLSFKNICTYICCVYIYVQHIVYNMLFIVYRTSCYTYTYMYIYLLTFDKIYSEFERTLMEKILVT